MRGCTKGQVYNCLDESEEVVGGTLMDINEVTASGFLSMDLHGWRLRDYIKKDLLLQESGRM